MNDPRLSLTKTLVVMLLAILPAANSRGEVVEWSQPSADWWAYVNGFNSGSRNRAPSFTGVAVDESTGEFETNGATAPARYASTLIAFETSDDVTPSLDPSRYLINSVSLTLKTQVGGFVYDDQPTTTAELLAEASGSGIDGQKPIELFGVGFQGGYDGFAYGVDQSGTRFSEANTPYNASGYVAYPISGDGQGGYDDVSNSFTGGYSATAPGNQTTPFDATPWAVGTTGLSPGQVVGNETTFVFDLDLDLPGVEDYLQQSLADGVLGFMVSSMHAAGFQGFGGGAYPQWYTKEAVGVLSGGEAPTLTVDVTIAPLAGDYNGDEVVDQADYTAWKSAFGGVVANPFDGADGNGDGFVDAADFTVWRDNYQSAATTLAVAGTAVPEPTSAAYFVGGVLTVGFCFGVGFWPVPRSPWE